MPLELVALVQSLSFCLFRLGCAVSNTPACQLYRPAAAPKHQLSTGTRLRCTISDSAGHGLRRSTRQHTRHGGIRHSHCADPARSTAHNPNHAHNTSVASHCASRPHCTARAVGWWPSHGTQPATLTRTSSREPRPPWRSLPRRLVRWYAGHATTAWSGLMSKLGRA